MTGRRTFHGIQGLRGIAALLVVCYHIASSLSDRHAASFRGDAHFRSLPIFFAGNGGVDLFFVISGFVIAWTTRDQWWQPHAWSRFLAKRLSRIVPLYWILTTIKVVLILSMPYLFRGFKPTSWDIIASYLLLPVLDAEGRINLVITAGWTLCFEMAFYYLCTICLALRRQPVVFVAPLLIASGLLGALWTAHTDALTFLINPLLLEFVAGMLIGELSGRGRVRGRLGTMMALLILGFAAWIAGGFLDAATEFAVRVVVWGVPAAIILYAVIALESHFDFNKLRLLMLIGDASYSIYLTHVFVLQPLIAPVRSLNLPLAGQWAAFALLIMVALSFGISVWWWVERKLILNIKNVFNIYPRRA